MNNISLIGRISTDIDVTETNDYKIAKFSIAVNRGDKNQTTDFIPCTAWNGTADFVEKYFKKGVRIGVTGALHIDKYESDNGNRYYTNVLVTNVDFADGNTNPSSDAKKSWKK